MKVSYDARGFPVLKGDKSAKPERTSILLNDLRRLPLVGDDDRVLGPAEALEVLLSDGPIPAREFDALASQYADPKLIYTTAEQIGAVRRKGEDGTLAVLLPAPEQESPNEINLADTGREESMIRESPNYGAAALVPLREAQELLGRPVIGSGLTIVREGRNRYVNKRELNDHLARAGRGGKGKGAAEKIANALEDATQRRAATNRAGQANDAHRRRYGQAKLGGRD